MAWFTREKTSLKTEEGERKVRTEGLWLKCEHCGEIIWRKALEDNLQVCPKCGHHDRINARTRLTMLFDDGQFEEFDTQLVSSDPLEFVDSRTYKKRLASNQQIGIPAKNTLPTDTGYRQRRGRYRDWLVEKSRVRRITARNPRRGR